MSCNRSRDRFFTTVSMDHTVCQAFEGDERLAKNVIETIYDTAIQRQDIQPAVADALTRMLFKQMESMSIQPPTHEAGGLPKADARQGYAAVAQTLMAIRTRRALPTLAAQIVQNQTGIRTKTRASSTNKRQHEMAPDVVMALKQKGVAKPRFRMPPNAPHGNIPPEIMSVLKVHFHSLQVHTARLMGRGANGAILGNAAVMDFLCLVADDICKIDADNQSDVPIVYWSHQLSASRLNLAYQQAMAVAIMTALEHPRCPECGQFIAWDTHFCPSNASVFDADGYNKWNIDRYGVTRNGTFADGTPAPKRRTLVDAAKDFIIASDPINNDGMADLWGRIASAVAGHDCHVVLAEGRGFATDMEGTIYADPYPLGRDADPRHNLIVTKAGIYHEIGHELTTPPEDWAYLVEVAEGKQIIPGLDKGRQFITKMYNIIEDGRMERDMSDRFLGVAETLAAQCRIYPRWDERVGAGVPLADEVVWPLLYTALPYFQVRDEVRDAMTPEGRALFEELEPLALQGALGSTEDSLAASIEIAKRLEAAGIFDIPSTSATPPPKPRPGTKPRSSPPSSGGPQGQQGQDAQQGSQQGQDAQQDGQQGQDAQQDGQQGQDAQQGSQQGQDAQQGSQQGQDAQQGGPVAGRMGDPTKDTSLSGEQLETILNDLEAQAVGAVEQEISRQGNYDVLGKLLHAPLSREGVTQQRYRKPSGQIDTINTETPVLGDSQQLRKLALRKADQQEISGRLARRLESIRQETLMRFRMQSEGQLDRRRFPAALAGREDVRTRISVTQDFGMAVSLLLDQSGSMGNHISQNQLYDAACIIGQALEQLEVPYEVRGHGGASMQYKSMDDPVLDEGRAARLSKDTTWSNTVTAPVVGLAQTALLARKDRNRLIVNLMDGEMEDHEAAVRQYQDARKQGVVTFGVFLGYPTAGQSQKMGELFGVSNWKPIETLKELPNVVGQRITDIFESIAEEA